jgi:16S rRNA (guanine966-N2)-methyltransferase
MIIGALRIVAGRFTRHRIYRPKGLDVAHTSDEVRAAAFALLGPSGGLDVLDLFAGSGAMGLEALSRGVAAHVLFVEPDPAAARAIHRNLDALRLRTPDVQVLREEPIRAIQSPYLSRGFDIVIVAPAPPLFASLEADLALHLHRVLWDEALVLVLTDRETRPRLPLTLADSSTCGAVRLSLYSVDDRL